LASIVLASCFALDAYSSSTISRICLTLSVRSTPPSTVPPPPPPPPPRPLADIDDDSAPPLAYKPPPQLDRSPLSTRGVALSGRRDA